MRRRPHNSDMSVYGETLWNDLSLCNTAERAYSCGVHENVPGPHDLFVWHGPALSSRRNKGQSLISDALLTDHQPRSGLIVFWCEPAGQVSSEVTNELNLPAFRDRPLRGLDGPVSFVARETEPDE